eukprot:scaffold58241_cov58-Phaeocystis_antarctica.AAC.1
MEVARLRLRLCDDLGRQGLGLSGLDGAHLARLALVRSGVLPPCREVDPVHGGFDRGVDLDVGDHRLEYRVAQARHRGLEGRLHVAAQLPLGHEELVEGEPGHGGAQRVEEARLDLLGRGGQPVVCGLHRHIALLHLILHGDAKREEDVILGLGLADGIELLQAHAQLRRHAIAQERVEQMAARLRDHRVLTKALEDLHRARRHHRPWEAARQAAARGAAHLHHRVEERPGGGRGAARGAEALGLGLRQLLRPLSLHLAGWLRAALGWLRLAGQVRRLWGGAGRFRKAAALRCHSVRLRRRRVRAGDLHEDRLAGRDAHRHDDLDLPAVGVLYEHPLAGDDPRWYCDLQLHAHPPRLLWPCSRVARRCLRTGC